MFKLGLVINPYAGIGGRVGLKGSDGEAVKAKALALGGLKLAETKAKNCLLQLKQVFSKLQFHTVSGEMGENLCKQLGLSYQVIYQASECSTEDDTKNAITQLQQQKLDLLLFAGGDGTARNVFEVCDEGLVVLGIPAGVKIHSAVYAISAEAAGLLCLELIQGKMLAVIGADVMDIDEQAFRAGQVRSKWYGRLQIPASMQHMQQVKQAAPLNEELALEDIAAEVIESMQDDSYYVIGSGSTCAVIMQQLNLQNTLLGYDIVYQQTLVQSDVTEKDLLALLKRQHKVSFVITIIGGQGHILGRGNHQISPQVIRLAGWQRFQIIATPSKLESLKGRPLRVDSGDVMLDHQLYGSEKIIMGYRHYCLYPVAGV